MLRKLREKIERALERRAQRRTPTRDDVDRLLHGMREEVIELRARIPRLEKKAAELERRATRQLYQAESAHRRAAELRGADSMEAERMLHAAESALRQAEDLRAQADDTRDELGRLKDEAAQKMAQLKSAERNRDVLLARARRAGTARKLEEVLRGPESGLRKFEQAEEDAAYAEDLAAATAELESDLEEGRSIPPEDEAELRRLDTASSIEERLRELKQEIEQERDA